MESTKKILFVCVENAGRSQIAEAFFKKYASKKFQAVSAGTKPSMEVNPVVVEAMKEVGIDISQKPKPISNMMIENSFRTVNMGCIDKDSCPAIFVNDIVDWGIPDPKGKSLDEVRQIRDTIETKIKNLVKTLEEK